MSFICHPRSYAAALGLLAMVVPCQAQDNVDLQKLVSDLQEKNRTLELSLVEANKAEKESTEQLTKVRVGLEALGKNLLDGGDDRLIQAAADLELANERINTLETASVKLAASVQEYLLEAVVSDPEARMRVETAIRELDSVTGLRQKPRPDVRTGNLQQAKIVSLDQATGMLVLNLGESQGAKIGMTFRLIHGQQPYGKAILADVRKGISGAFVEQIDTPGQTPRLGDTAALLTQN
ncbi:MAG: hypothetical protein NWT08_02415 [Akkermansiaceae bacterium]|jgi:hypothetical protein|nr:hypothetical protein [Akkermansiaceae bacterium]MDP4646257.1 hypothetical protein [Akkermansiaceae bacterium]MDP4720261.1 hypothetical protein [Akkermansiaceae bacterium]MDP4779902.1 hypothetical protein [Akkermansiaceae bacterium]MDP4845869.1 hypothetical protein [Akkermansiaceae bacterium]